MIRLLCIIFVLLLPSSAVAGDFERDQIFLKVIHKNRVLEIEDTNKGQTKFKLSRNYDMDKENILSPFQTRFVYHRDEEINGIGIGLEKTHWHNKFSYLGVGLDLDIREPDNFLLDTNTFAGLKYKFNHIITLNAEFGFNYQFKNSLDYNWITNYLDYGVKIKLDDTTSFELSIVEDRDDLMQIQNTNARIGLIFHF